MENEQIDYTDSDRIGKAMKQIEMIVTNTLNLGNLEVILMLQWWVIYIIDSKDAMLQN